MRKEDVTVDDGIPLYSIYIGIHEHAKLYERIYPGVEETIGKSGGFFLGMAYLFNIIVIIGSSINFETRLIQFVLGTFSEDDPDT